jgi:hypothetical protein
MQEFKLISKADPEETKALRVFVTNVETVGLLYMKNCLVVWTSKIGTDRKAWYAPCLLNCIVANVTLGRAKWFDPSAKWAFSAPVWPTRKAVSFVPLSIVQATLPIIPPDVTAVAAAQIPRSFLAATASPAKAAS